MHDYDITAGTVGWDARVREIWGIGPDEVVTFDAFLGGRAPGRQGRDAGGDRRRHRPPEATGATARPSGC